MSDASGKTITYHDIPDDFFEFVRNRYELEISGDHHRLGVERVE